MIQSDLIRMGVKPYKPKEYIAWDMVACWCVILFACGYFWGAVIKTVWRAWAR